MAAIALIRSRIEWCEAQGVEILCCPEAVLGGLADAVAATLAAAAALACYVPARRALRVDPVAALRGD